LRRDQGGGCDHCGVLPSLVYRLVRCLFALLAVLVRADLSKDVELLVLRQENQVLRRQRTPRMNAIWAACYGLQPWAARRLRRPYRTVRFGTCSANVVFAHASARQKKRCIRRRMGPSWPPTAVSDSRRS
jgi:hypothetical protein